MGANFPGQSVNSWGQPSQVASCWSHSAGILKPEANGEVVTLVRIIRKYLLCEISEERLVASGERREKTTQRCGGRAESFGNFDEDNFYGEAKLFAQPAVEDGLVGVDAAVA